MSQYEKKIGEKMKVLQINAIYGFSSTGKTALELNDALIEKGHESIVVTTKASSGVNNAYIMGNKIDWLFHGLFSRLFGLQGYFSFISTKKLINFIKKEKPDVIHLRNLHANYINVPVLLKYIAKNDIPTVVTLHDCWFFTGKCCHYTADNCFKWTEKCDNCPALKKYNKSWFFDFSRKMFNDKKKLFGNISNLTVVTVSDWLLGEVKKSPIFKNAEKKRIYNWIDTDKFVQTDSKQLKKNLGLENKKVLLCVAGGWTKEKGFETVVKLSQKLNEDERILLVGIVYDKSALNEKIINVPATESVDELIGYYSMADVFVQPSIQETFGKVVAESLSCGTPAVCFASTANPELVKDGCGASVPVGDIDSMLKEIRNILDNGKEKYSTNCRNFAVDNFNKEKNIQEYFDLYEKFIGE